MCIFKYFSKGSIMKKGLLIAAPKFFFFIKNLCKPLRRSHSISIYGFKRLVFLAEAG